MRTDDLIDLLAREAGPAPRALAARRLSPAALAGLLFSAATAVFIWGVVPADMLASSALWIKAAYAGSLASAAGWLTARLSRPAASATRPGRASAAVVLAMVLFAGVWLMLEPSGTRMQAVLGQSSSRCTVSVLTLSLPALAATLWAVRGLAPTRLRATGFAAGVFAGSVGALGYAISCTELSPAFVAIWYTLGIALTGVVGALLGPKLLRW